MPLPDRASTQAEAEALGLTLTATQADQLLAYVDLLRRWNATYNLTAVRDPAAMWRQHVIDCLAAVPSVRAHMTASPGSGRNRILDVGSGGGLPGVVWAVVMPEVDVVCVDTVGKKAAFIRQAAGALALPNLQSRHSRVEVLRDPPFDLITSRAFASLRDFVQGTRHLLADHGSWVAMKGKLPTDELATLAWPGPMFHVEQLQVPGLDAERCLVWLKNDVQRAPDMLTA